MRRQRINKAILTGVMLLGFTVVAFGRLQNDQIPSSYQSSGFGKTAVEYNLPAVDLSWVGAGQLTVYTTDYSDRRRDGNITMAHILRGIVGFAVTPVNFPEEQNNITAGRLEFGLAAWQMNSKKIRA